MVGEVVLFLEISKKPEDELGLLKIGEVEEWIEELEEELGLLIVDPPLPLVFDELVFDLTKEGLLPLELPGLFESLLDMNSFPSSFTRSSGLRLVVEDSEPSLFRLSLSLSLSFSLSILIKSFTS